MKSLKTLIVYTVNRSDLYPAGTWEETVHEDGRLIVVRADGTKAVYAPGHWTRTDTSIK